jgi:hypothetical protein
MVMEQDPLDRGEEPVEDRDHVEAEQRETGHRGEPDPREPSKGGSRAAAGADRAAVWGAAVGWEKAVAVAVGGETALRKTEGFDHCWSI